MKGYGFGGAGGTLASYESHGKGESELIGGDAKVEPTGSSGNFPSYSSSSSASPARSSPAASPARSNSSGGFCFCTECGFKLNKGAKFCSECGQKQ